VQTDSGHSKPGLRQQLVRSVTQLVLVMTITILGAVIYTSQQTVGHQIDSQLQVGLRVFEKLIAVREAALLSSAEILTSDFGFRQAVATKDKETIRSVLDNHSARIHADLIYLIDFDGSILQTTTSPEKATSSAERTNKSENGIALDFSDTQHKKLIDAAISDGAASSFDFIDGKVLQLIAVTVNAPEPIAIAIIGFEMNDALAEELRALTGLHISFSVHNERGTTIAASTLPLHGTDAIAQLNNDGDEMLRIPFSGSDRFASRSELLQEVGGNAIHVHVSTALREANLAFDQLQVEITLIAIACFAASIIAGMLLARHIVHPVKQLARVAREVALGHYGQRIDVATQTQELENLVSAFNAMDAQINLREREILHQAHHDALTGILNGNRLFDIIKQRTEHKDATFFLALINIKDFRAINDAFGRDAGDQCLIDVSHRMRQHLPADTHCARISADYLFISEGLFEDAAQGCLAQMHQTLSQGYRLNGVEKLLEFSISIVEFPRQGDNLETLWRRLNLAMDDSRKSRQAFYCYRDGQDEQHLRRLRLLTDLRHALANPHENQLALFYQPKLDLRSDNITHVEALIRWMHPTEGFIRPDDFIPLAEQTGLINELTFWVIDTAAAQARQWKDAGMNLCIAVNLCASDLINPQFKPRLNEILDHNRVDPNALSFEITESAIIHEPASAIELLQKLRDRGFSIAVDDFGTGYSSLAQLKHLPVNELKIDKSFVLKLDQNKDDQIIVNTTIHMAHDLGLHVVAEGVENQQAQKLLYDMGCDYIQGYHLCKPIPAAELSRWITQRDKPSAA